MVARSRKETKALRPMNRDARGRFVKNKTIDFFAFPLEIRSMIYTHVFRYEEPSRTEEAIYDPTSSFKMKAPLLRTSKLVRVEALPHFYRHHVFHIPVPRAVTATCTPRIYNSINKVQLIAPEEPAELYHYPFMPNCKLAPLEHVLSGLPNLQLVRIGYAVVSYLRMHYLPPRADELFRELLAQLWQRLIRLEINVLEDNEKVDTLEFRKAVAPDAQWVLEADGKVGGYWRGVWRSVWVAQRDGKLPIQNTSTAEVP